MQENDSGTIKGLFIGLSIGFIAGAVTAMFLTTKTGEELRSDIRKIALDIKGKVEERAGKVKDISRDRYSEIVDNVIESYNKVKDFTEKEIELIRKIITEKKESASK
jgi:gas vesicle protein